MKGGGRPESGSGELSASPATVLGSRCIAESVSILNMAVFGKSAGTPRQDISSIASYVNSLIEILQLFCGWISAKELVSTNYRRVVLFSFRKTYSVKRARPKSLSAVTKMCACGLRHVEMRFRVSAEFRLAVTKLEMHKYCTKRSRGKSELATMRLLRVESVHSSEEYNK